MNSCVFWASFEFAFAAILFVFHQSQDLVPRSSHSLSWPPFWINFLSPWTNRSRDFCCVPESSLLLPPYWKTRRPWGRGWARISRKNQLTNTGNDAFDFLGKRVFSEKNNDAIKYFWTDVLFLRKRSRHRQTQRPYVCHPKNERKRKVFLLFFVWFYLNM